MVNLRKYLVSFWENKNSLDVPIACSSQCSTKISCSLIGISKPPKGIYKVPCEGCTLPTVILPS